MKQEYFIPGYTIKERIGDGSTSLVYKGIQEKFKRKVAIKILKPSFLKKGDSLLFFLHEAEIASSLNFSNIVGIYNVGQSGNCAYIVMEFLKESLKDKLKRNGPFPLEKALSIIKQMAQALNYAHNRNIVHRDIKTANILFRNHNTPVLVDFGLALNKELTKDGASEGLILGTLPYMSPELCKGFPGDRSSDFYSLGIVLFEILTGNKPYKADSIDGYIKMHLEEPIPRLPQDLDFCQPLIDRMMEKNPQKRIQDGNQVIDFIDTLCIEKEIILDWPKDDTSPHDKDYPKNKKKLLLMLLFLSIAAFITVVVFIIHSFENAGQTFDQTVLKNTLNKEIQSTSVSMDTNKPYKPHIITVLDTKSKKGTSEQIKSQIEFQTVNKIELLSNESRENFLKAIKEKESFRIEVKGVNRITKGNSPRIIFSVSNDGIIKVKNITGISVEPKNGLNIIKNALKRKKLEKLPSNVSSIDGKLVNALIEHSIVRILSRGEGSGVFVFDLE